VLTGGPLWIQERIKLQTKVSTIPTTLSKTNHPFSVERHASLPELPDLGSFATLSYDEPSDIIKRLRSRKSGLPTAALADKNLKFKKDILRR